MVKGYFGNLKKFWRCKRNAWRCRKKDPLFCPNLKEMPKSVGSRVGPKGETRP